MIVVVPGCVIASQSPFAPLIRDLPVCRPAQATILFDGSSRNFSWYGYGRKPSTPKQNFAGLSLIALRKFNSSALKNSFSACGSCFPVSSFSFCAFVSSSLFSKDRFDEMVPNSCNHN